MIKPKVSVVIPTFNRFEYLLNAIESVNLQDYENLEIIVVNDASTQKEYYEYDFKKNIKDSINKIDPNLLNIIKRGNIFPDFVREYIIHEVTNTIFLKKDFCDNEIKSKLVISSFIAFFINVNRCLVVSLSSSSLAWMMSIVRTAMASRPVSTI